MQMYRQGDVLVERLSAGLPKKGLEKIERKQNAVILAEGEKTGHSHHILDEGATLFRDPKLAEMFLSVTADASVKLRHQEHATIEIPPGSHKVTRQKEYSPQAIRTVAD